MSSAALFGWYMLGAVMHVLFRWSGWKQNNNERAWIDYWKRHAAFNIKSLIVAVVLSFIWVQELLPFVLDLIPGWSDLGIPVIERTNLSSIAVGFCLELIMARVIKRFWSGNKK